MRAGAGARWTSSTSTCVLLLGRCRSSVPHRLRSDAARTAHDARAPARGDAHLVVPRLEAPRVDAAARPVRDRARGRRPTTRSRSWRSSPVRRRARRDRRPHLGPLRARPAAAAAFDRLRPRASEVIGADPHGQGRGRDRRAAPRPRTRSTTIAAEMRSRPFAGRTELDVHRELVERMLARRSRARRTSRSSRRVRTRPARTTSRRADRIDRRRRASCCAISAARCSGYCSDITRMFHVGEPTAEIRDLYDVLAAAQEAGVRAATVGTPCEDVDAAARRGHRRRRASASSSCIASGTASAATRTRTRTWSSGNDQLLEAGHAFSVEPGIYLPGSVRHAARRHRRRDGCGPGPAERRGRAISRRRLPESTDEARRRHVPAPMGRGRPARSAGSRRAGAR